MKKLPLVERVLLYCTVIQAVVAVLTLFMEGFLVSILILVSFIILSILLITLGNFRKLNERYAAITSDNHYCALKYIAKTQNRKSNPVHIESVIIDYLLTDNMSNDFIDFRITYHFHGVSSASELHNLFIYSSLTLLDSCNNIIPRAHFIKKGVRSYVTPTIISSEPFLIHWNLPLVGKIKAKESFDYELELTWKKYLVKSSPDICLIDPMNYAESIGAISINMENQSSDFEIFQLEACEYSRETFKCTPYYAIASTRKQKWEYTFDYRDSRSDIVYALGFRASFKDK